MPIRLQDGLTAALTLLVAIGLITSLSMGAGAAETTEEDVIDAIEGVDTYQYETESGSTTVVVEDGEEQVTVSEAEGSGAVDVANDEFMETMTVETTGEEAIGDVFESESYLVDDTLYTATSFSGEDAEWLKMDAPEDDAFAEGPLAEQERLLSVSEAEDAGEDEIDGTDTYVLELTVDAEAYWDEIEAEFDDEELDEMNDGNANDVFTDSIEEMTVTMWIDAETDQPVKSELTMTTCVDEFPEYEADGIEGNDDADADVDADEVEESGDVEGTGMDEIDRIETEMTETTYFHSYDESIDIELPDEAEDAQDLDEQLAEIEEDFETDADAHDEEVAEHDEEVEDYDEAVEDHDHDDADDASDADDDEVDC